MGKNSFLTRARNRVKVKFIKKVRNKPYYYWMYPSFIHSIIFAKDKTVDMKDFYLTACPNSGAGIGHQMANWNSGYWFAKFFKLKFAHTPFSIRDWESFLGFGSEEIQVQELIENGYKLIRLPLFNEQNQIEVLKIKNIINSYSGKKIIFVCEQDQFYIDQYGIMKELQKKFYNSSNRKTDRLIYNKDNFNIAIHVRRGDIVQKEGEDNQNLTMRWLDNDYFVNALINTLKIVKTNKPIHIYLFSQGRPEEYPEFKDFENLHFCLDMSAQESFLHMCYADALITSKSSFSYKPALLNRGLKICPSEFWHRYPNSQDWVMLDNNGKLKRRT